MVKQVNSRTKCCVHDSITLRCSQNIVFNCASHHGWIRWNARQQQQQQTPCVWPESLRECQRWVYRSFPITTTTSYAPNETVPADGVWCVMRKRPRFSIQNALLYRSSALNSLNGKRRCILYTFTAPASNQQIYEWTEPLHSGQCALLICCTTIYDLRCTRNTR